MEILKFNLKDKEFYKFRELIYNESGINLKDLKKTLVQTRLVKRLKALNLKTFKDYYKYLIDNYEEEKLNFINSLTTNKTEFFREDHHFEYIKHVILPDLEDRGKREIRIWSAGCSTGEEPYSIAITLLEYFKKENMPNIKILATDIDTNVLEIAKHGIYRHERINNIDLKILKKYFLRGKGENKEFFKVKKPLNDMIYFNRLNLQGDTYPMRKKFDMIFCRNVIIYFNRETQKMIFNKLSEYLYDNGRLFLGHSENITSISSDFYLIGNSIYGKVI